MCLARKFGLDCDFSHSAGGHERSSRRFSRRLSGQRRKLGCSQASDEQGEKMGFQRAHFAGVLLVFQPSPVSPPFAAELSIESRSVAKHIIFMGDPGNHEHILFRISQPTAS